MNSEGMQTDGDLERASKSNSKRQIGGAQTSAREARSATRAHLCKFLFTQPLFYPALVAVDRLLLFIHSLCYLIPPKTTSPFTTSLVNYCLCWVQITIHLAKSARKDLIPKTFLELRKRETLVAPTRKIARKHQRTRLIPHPFPILFLTLASKLWLLRRDRPYLYCHLCHRHFRLQKHLSIPWRCHLDLRRRLRSC